MGWGEGSEWRRLRIRCEEVGVRGVFHVAISRD